MGVELEVGPPVEILNPTDGDLDIPEMVAHLYFVDTAYTLCGISNKDDPHERMHVIENFAWYWEPGKTECGCGAPICPKCNAIALKLKGEPR